MKWLAKHPCYPYCPQVEAVTVGRQVFMAGGEIGHHPPSPRGRKSWLTAAIPMDNPYCSCKLTRVRPRCSGWPAAVTARQ